MLRMRLWLMAATLLSAIPALLSAADKKLAITDINLVDVDFAFQGEYVGSVLTGLYDWQPIALQVIALGEGKFEAVEYGGGLPGAGAFGKARIRIPGQLNGDAVTFISGPLTIVIRDRLATMALDSYAHPIGHLKKIQRSSPTLGAPPPSDAIVLFDGTHTDHFKGGRMTENGLLMVGTETKEAYRDFTLHLEFRLPYMPHARGQGRSNSGVYVQSRYEVQILDSFGLDGKHNECGGLYKQRQPALNMCLPPLTWQTYDIDFRSPRFDDSGNKTDNARITVRHNGVLIHDDVEITAKTGAGKKEDAEPLPTKLQDHRNPVVFRNIWIVKRGESVSDHSLAVDSSNPSAPVTALRLTAAE